MEKRNKDFQERNHELLLQRERLELNEEALQQLNASKDEFFSMVAKDLRFPLTSLSAYLSVMLKETTRLTKDELNTLAVKVDGSVRHLWHLIDNLLHWSRQQMRSVETHPVNFSIERMIKKDLLFICNTLQITEHLSNHSLYREVDWVSFN
ncbi:MAG: histidine kinase dimerization/phospho-acceptor domain-containing protein [Bacteroidota bacterium]